jgi:hypothetical protein
MNGIVMPATGIMVSVAPPSDRGRLYPRYVEDAGILAVESKVKRPWPFGVDLDARIIFDLDEQRVLANFDLHWRKSRWKRDIGVEPLPSAPPGDLVFALETISAKSFSLPMQVRINPQSRVLRIEFGMNRPDRSVALSDSCIAFLSASELIGFAIEEIA